MDKISGEVLKLGKILWDYQKLNVVLRPATVVIATGCEDARVAERAAQLYTEEYCEWIVCTGRSGQRTKAMLEAKGYSSEAEYFADIIHRAGIPTDRILKEDRATHSVENIAYTQDYLLNGLVGRVQRMKAYGERGFQAKTMMPSQVWDACQRLIELGYTDQVVAT